MTPFCRAEFTRTSEETYNDLVSRGVSEREARECVEHRERSEVWTNDLYQVLLDRTPPHGMGPNFVVWYLSIRRLDREAIHDWRHLQQIKNELCGADCEGVELYPSEKRVVDGANQYHLWVIMHPAGWRFPFGFTPSGPVRSTPAQAAKFGAKQRPQDSVPTLIRRGP